MTIGRPADPDKLSRKPDQVRRRLRRAKKHADKTGDETRLRQDLEIYSEATGLPYKDVSTWDLEELAHGRPKGPDGKMIKGAVPTWLTPDIQREAKKRLYQQTLGKVGAKVDKAIRVVEHLLLSEEVDDKGRPIVDARTKLDAAKWIIEHVVGKPAAQIQISATEEAQQMFAAAIVLDDGRQDTHLVLEGQVVEKDDDEDLMEDDSAE